MDRVAGFLGVLGLAAAAGGLAIGDLVIVPGLMGESMLIDANQATSLVGPLHLRCTEITLAGTIVAALALPRWLGSRFATSITLLAIACAAISRLLVLPRMYDAWGKVDLVAARPIARLHEAEELARQLIWLDASLAILLLGVAGCIAAGGRRASRQAGSILSWRKPAAATAAMPTVEPDVAATAA